MSPITLYCPYDDRFYAVLDKSKLNEDDPGAGDACIIYGPHGSKGSFNAARSMEELAAGDTVIDIPGDVWAWIDEEVADAVDEYIFD